AQAIDVAKAEATRAVAAEDFEAAMRAMASLRPYVDAFFDKVTVNVDNKPLRENRLKLLNEIRAATRAVADFSRSRGNRQQRRPRACPLPLRAMGFTDFGIV